MVKTIGDAIMAVFPSTYHALRAALESQMRMVQLDVAPEVNPWRLLKIGIHAGPCVMVNLNDRLDYFGTTVNTAARAEGQARGGDIILTLEASHDPDVEKLLVSDSLRVEPFEAQLRGLSKPVAMLRINFEDDAALR